MYITLVGRADADKRIRQCRDLLDSEAVQDAILPAAQLLRDVAKRLVNIGPGIRTGKAHKGEKRKHLRDLIFATKGKKYKGFGGAIFNKLNGPSVIAGIDLKRAPHAHLVEYGHGGTSPAPAYPFLRPAVASVRWAIVQIIESALKRLLAPFSKAA
jgi:HK97 gp10 family phage protein